LLYKHPVDIMESTSSSTHKVLVVGATGATGKHVVRMLLDRGDTTVVAVTRSKEKLMALLKPKDDDDRKKKENNLIVKEAAIADLGPKELKDLTEGCQAIVSCLGHNMTFQGMYRDGYWLRDVVQDLTESMPKDEDGSCRFILMGSDGVAHPDGVTDPKRSFFERSVMFLMRYLLPPMADNEKSALYLYQQKQKEEKGKSPPFDWCIVRPGDLIDKEEGKDDGATKEGKGYIVYDHAWGSLFGGDTFISRSDVADFMVELATTEQKNWKVKYNHKMPVVYQKGAEEEKQKEKKQK